MDVIRIGSGTPRSLKRLIIIVATVLITSLASPFNIFSKSFANNTIPLPELPDSIVLSTPVIGSQSFVDVDSINASGKSLSVTPIDSIPILDSPSATAIIDSIAASEGNLDGRRIHIFNPDPTRAVWLSALFPGLGQIYNRRYWKLPIVVGAFMGLGYGSSWNNGMLRDYTKAYNDLMDNDPTTSSYMDFFPSSVKEEDLDKSWLSSTLRYRKDYFRRNRDLCIICMVGVYLIAMVDAYVDASLAHFDITPDLSMQVTPALIPDSRTTLPGVGVQWAFNF